MKVSPRTKILYFIKDLSPTQAELEAAAKIPTLTFRTVQGFNPNDFIEQCDGVAGLVPPNYAAKFPVVDKKEEPKPSEPAPATVAPAAPVATTPAPVPTPAPASAGAPPWAAK